MSLIDALIAKLTGWKWRICADHHIRSSHPLVIDEHATVFWTNWDSHYGGRWSYAADVADRFDTREDAERVAVSIVMKHPEWAGDVFVQRA